MSDTAARHCRQGIPGVNLWMMSAASWAGLDRTPGALEHSAVILFEARHIMTSILRSSRQLRLATGKAVWSERTCNSAESYLICLTSSTWGYPRTSSRVQGLV